MTRTWTTLFRQRRQDESGSVTGWQDLGCCSARPRKPGRNHSTAMYDMANPVTVKGTVKRFQWTYRVDEFFCENNRDFKPLFGAK